MTSSITQTVFGSVDGQAVDLYTLRNKEGMTVKITNYGGIITSIEVPDKEGNMGDIVLGFDSLSGYLQEVPYFGALIGRYGNRIGKGQFTLDGKTYKLPVNNGPNSLHGGVKGFDKKVWAAEEVQTDSTVGLKLKLTSPDGDQGYPGTLQVTVTYTLSNDNALKINYEATTDKATVINLTNHTYFNLNEGKQDVLAHEVQLDASRFVPVSETLIPTGKLQEVKGTPFDFTKSKAIGKEINDSTDVQIKNGGGYDHCWIFDQVGKNPVAHVYDPASGRTIEMTTTEPAVQFYSGNFLDGKLSGKNMVNYKKRWGFCLETEHYPDSPNQPAFPSTILKPGETYTSSTVYHFSVKK
ncbi:MAG: aldose epimerase family protein [Siphonobacter sp.]